MLTGVKVREAQPTEHALPLLRYNDFDRVRRGGQLRPGRRLIEMLQRAVAIEACRSRFQLCFLPYQAKKHVARCKDVFLHP
jgi:hypothetical protein